MGRISTSLWPGFKPDGIVSYRDVPVFRAQAWALELVKYKKGVTPCILSVIRIDWVINQHNRQFGTNLHGQQYLFDNQNRPGFNPANPPNRTSHCGFADGNHVYGTPGSRIPYFEYGIDACTNETASRIVKALDELGYRAVQPYSSGSELHHLSLWPTHPDGKAYIANLRKEYLALWKRKKLGG